MERLLKHRKYPWPAVLWWKECSHQETRCWHTHSRKEETVSKMSTEGFTDCHPNLPPCTTKGKTYTRDIWNLMFGFNGKGPGNKTGLLWLAANLCHHGRPDKEPPPPKKIPKPFSRDIDNGSQFSEHRVHSFHCPNSLAEKEKNNH